MVDPVARPVDDLLGPAEMDAEVWLSDPLNRKPNETDREFVVRCVLARCSDWLREHDTETELAMEMVKDGNAADLIDARARVRLVCDLVYEAIYRRTGFVG